MRKIKLALSSIITAVFNWIAGEPMYVYCKKTQFSQSKQHKTTTYTKVSIFSGHERFGVEVEMIAEGWQIITEDQYYARQK